MEKTKSWYMRLRMSDRFANEMNCFTLGGSLIPPKSKFGGIATPARGDFVRQAVSILGSLRVKAEMVLKRVGSSLVRNKVENIHRDPHTETPTEIYHNLH